MILSAALPPCVSVNKVALARELGISRTLLRRACLGLSEGLVVSHPRRGFFVSPLDVKDAREVYPLLAALEVFALRTGAKVIAADKVALERPARSAPRSRAIRPRRSRPIERGTNASYRTAGTNG